MANWVRQTTGSELETGPGPGQTGSDLETEMGLKAGLSPTLLKETGSLVRTDCFFVLMFSIVVKSHII